MIFILFDFKDDQPKLDAISFSSFDSSKHDVDTIW